MRFRGLDLNLMVALDALLEERNVSRAAKRLYITQPAMSAALNRLRTYFSDDILAAHGKKMIPTSTGESLIPLVKSILGEIDVLASTATIFDPSRSARVFRIAASDYITAVLLKPLAIEMERDSTNLILDIELISEHAAVRLNRGEIDLMLTPTEFISPEHPTDLLFEEEHVVVGWRKNPIFRRPLDEHVFFAAGHVAVRIGTGRVPSFIEQQLQALGRKRRIELIAPSFLEVPWLLLESMRLGVMHRRLAQEMSSRLPLAVAPIPFSLPPMREMMQYNQARQTDAGLTWLRGRISALASRL
ncbi:MAG: LysR family transcriptional regulator [Acetobacteraceae bacterium]